MWNTKSVGDGYPFWIRIFIKDDQGKIISEDISDNAFSIDNSLKHTGWVFGVTTEFIEDEISFLEGVQICIILSDIDNIITSKCTFSDENGSYLVPVPSGIYSVQAYKEGYISSFDENVQVYVNEYTEADFLLEKGEDTSTVLLPYIVDVNRDEIEEALVSDQIGVELSIQSSEEKLESIVSSFSDISITPTVNFDENYISLFVDGDVIGGRTIIINLADELLDFDQVDEIQIEYDGHPIKMASDLIDVLNPDDDGIFSEYIITVGEDGLQLLISIPHFSEHNIVIYQLEQIVEEIGGITTLITYVLICSLSIVVFISPVFIRYIRLVYFQKKK